MNESDSNAHLMEQPSVSYSEGFEFNRQIFQAATITAAGAFALMITFLGSVWSDKAAAKVTMDAIFQVAAGMVTYPFLLLLVALKSGLDRRSAKWLDNLNRTLPVWAFLIVGFVIFALGKWYFALEALVGRAT